MQCPIVVMISVVILEREGLLGIIFGASEEVDSSVSLNTSPLSVQAS